MNESPLRGITTWGENIVRTIAEGIELHRESAGEAARNLADALTAQEDDMCPNCVTPWKCNGPHKR